MLVSYIKEGYLSLHVHIIAKLHDSFCSALEVISMHVHFKTVKISCCYILQDLEKAVFVGCYGGHGTVG